MEGGRFIKAGGYGCIFTPPLLCKSGLTKNPNMVGKITLIDEMRQELKIAQAIRKIPLNKHYFILPDPESCALLPQKEQIDPGVDECLDRSGGFEDIYKKKKEMFPASMVRQIFLPYGGDKDLASFMYNFSKNPQKKMNFFNLMEHLLEAGSTLLLAQVCHMDIHPGNFLIDKHNVVRIIDYGISFLAKDINEKTVSGDLKNYVYIFENEVEAIQRGIMNNVDAPELNIMQATRKNQQPKYKQNLEEAILLTVKRKPIFAKMEIYLGMSMYSSFEALSRFWEDSNSAKERDYVKLYKTYWPGFDAWSIGALLFEIYQLYMYEKDFIDGVYKKKKDFILNALRGLLNPNPKLRLDCMEALAVLNPNNTWIERYGKKWLEARKKQRSS